MKVCLDRPGTMSNNRAGPIPSATGVRSMTTVTYRLPQRVCRQTCSSTPKTLTPVRRLGSSMSNRRPVANTASLRSEERRVGKEGRSGWAACHEKKKEKEEEGKQVCKRKK